MPDGHETTLSPEQAVDRLEALHAEAVRAQRDALARRSQARAAQQPRNVNPRHGGMLSRISHRPLSPRRRQPKTL
jgi:hypothetical protein